MSKFNLKKAFLVVLIVSLSISALFGIFVFLFGSFGETEQKILSTSLVLGGFSLTGLCAGVWYDKKRYLPLSFAGMIVSATGFVFAVPLIWQLIKESETLGKTMAIISLLSVSLAHASLVLLGYNKNKKINKVIIATLCSSAVLTALLIAAIINEFNGHEFVRRIIGVFSILTSLGTIVVPILFKVVAGNESMYDVVLVYPGKSISENEKQDVDAYLNKLETEGKKVYTLLDMGQEPSLENRIFLDNKNAIKSSREVHLWRRETNQENLFELGMAWALDKRLVIVNKDTVIPGQTSPFDGLINWWEHKTIGA